MTPSLSKANRTRNYIIEKTAPLFNAKGIVGTSLNDMVEATGLTKGSVYGNFLNKDELALAVFDYNFGKVVALVRTKINKRTTAIEKLLVYPEIYRHFLKISFLKGGCPLLNTAVESDDTHPLLREKAVNALKLWRNSIEDIVRMGIEHKEVKTDINVTEFASVVMSMIEGAVMIAKVTGKSTELNLAMNYLEKMIKGIRI